MWNSFALNIIGVEGDQQLHECAATSTLVLATIQIQANHLYSKVFVGQNSSLLSHLHVLSFFLYVQLVVGSIFFVAFMTLANHQQASYTYTLSIYVKQLWNESNKTKRQTMFPCSHLTFKFNRHIWPASGGLKTHYLATCVVVALG
jgi:hypothetical protein